MYYQAFALLNQTTSPLMHYR